MQNLPPDIRPLIEDNVRLLRQLDQLLGALDDARYTDGQSPLFDSPLGLHFRHVLEHYDCLLQGLGSGRVDYDARRRETALETSTEAARQRLRALLQRLDAIDVADRALEVVQCSSNESAAAQRQLGSTLARELAFLHSHTVHHQASISALLRYLGASELEPADFGIAPATVQHQEVAGCAR